MDIDQCCLRVDGVEAMPRRPDAVAATTLTLRVIRVSRNSDAIAERGTRPRRDHLKFPHGLAPHVEHAVRFIQHDERNTTKSDEPPLLHREDVYQAARCRYDNFGASLQIRDLLGYLRAAVDGRTSLS